MASVLLESKGMRFLPHLSESFCFHLWGSFNLKKIEAIDERFVLKSGTIYSHFAIPAILEDKL
jgi:hypothetical protein